MFHYRSFTTYMYQCLCYTTALLRPICLTAYVSRQFFYDLYSMYHCSCFTTVSFTTYMYHCLCFTTVSFKTYIYHCLSVYASWPFLVRPIVSLLMFHDRFFYDLYVSLFMRHDRFLYDLLYHYILMFHDRCFITSCFMTYTVFIVDLLLVLIFHDCEEEEKFIKVSVSRNLLPFLHVSGPKRPLINR